MSKPPTQKKITAASEAGISENSFLTAIHAATGDSIRAADSQ
jgi:hypothetical protein